MKTMKPTTRPKLTEPELLKLIKPFAIDRVKYPVIVVGIRGYYEDSMGKPDQNDRGIYDDAIFIHSMGVAFRAFNANTDPSIFRSGTGTGQSKGIASLVPGLYFAHKLDMHNGKYLALCQRVAPVKVLRDGSKGQYQDEGMFGINIHCGGVNTTGSEGCQTIPFDQWQEFIDIIRQELLQCFGSKYRAAVVPYLLLEQ